MTEKKEHDDRRRKEGVLTVCAICNSVKLPNMDDSWLDNGDPDQRKICDRFIDKYRGRISHTFPCIYCPDEAKQFYS